MAKRNNEVFRRFRRKWLDAGLCPACREHRPVVEGKTYCPSCFETHKRSEKKLYIARRLNDLCVMCGKPVEIEGRAYCAACVKKVNECMARRKAVRIQEGRL